MFFEIRNFKKVHDLFYRVTKVLLHFLVNTVYKKQEFFLKEKNAYKLHLSWDIMQIK